MQVDLQGRTASIIGHGALIETVVTALAANGAAVVRRDELAPAGEAARPDDILVVAHELQPEAVKGAMPALLKAASAAGRAMAERGSGRIVVLLSALGTTPMRRHPAASVAAAAAVAAVRTLAMTLAPDVLVNAIGAGAIAGAEDPSHFLSGAASMLSHVPLARPGTPKDVADAVLFLCDPLNTYMTGQVLTVDGGWTAGYGRDF